MSFKTSSLENLSLKELNTLFNTEFEKDLVKDEINLRMKCGVNNWWNTATPLKPKRTKTAFEKFKRDEIKQVVHLLGSTYFCGTELLEKHCVQTWDNMKVYEAEQIKKYRQDAQQDKKRFFFEKKMFSLLNK